MKKSLEWRLEELLCSLLVVRDALVSCHMQQWHQILPLSGQLRALLIERKSNIPLLRELAKDLNEVLEVYTMPEADPSQLPITDGLTHYFSGFPISLQKELPLQEQVSIEVLLKRKVLWIDGKPHTLEEVIGWHADKAGGAHFDENLPDVFVDWISLPGLGDGVANNVLCQLGEATYHLGKSFLKKQMCLEMHLLLAVRNSPDTPVYLMDAVYQDSKMRITIKLLPLGKLEWSITDNKGNMIKIAAQAITEWSNVRHLSFELGLTEDLLPTLKILIDGEIIAQGIGSIPLFVSSAFDNYTRFYNKPFDGDIQDFEFGLGEIVVIAAETKHLDKAKRELHFEEKKSNKDLSIRTFSTGSYGITDPGTKNIKMIGNVKKMDAQTFFNLKNNEV